MQKVVLRLNTSQKIIPFVHDPDASTSDSICQYWNITGYMDEVYASESFLRYFVNSEIGNTRYIFLVKQFIFAVLSAT